MITAKVCGYVCHHCKKMIDIKSPSAIDTRFDGVIKHFHLDEGCYSKWQTAIIEEAEFRLLEKRLSTTGSVLHS